MSYWKRPGYFLHLKLAPGVTTPQALVLALFMVVGTVVLLLFPTLQPYILQNQLHLDPAVFGRTAGLLALVQNVAMIATIPFLGALADRVGRNAMFLACLALLFVGCVLYPFVTTIPQAIAVSALVGVGGSIYYAVGGRYLFAYPAETARGKFIGTMVVLQYIANIVLIGVLGTHLPKWLAAHGLSMAMAVGVVFWIAACISLVGMLMVRIDPEPPRPKHGPAATVGAEARALGELLAQVYRHARRNPRFGVLMLLCFSFRSDYVVVMTFLSVWIVGSARSMGIDSADVLGTIGTLFILMRVGGLAVNLIAGHIADTVNRTYFLLFSLLLATGAFCLPLFVHNVLGWQLYAVVAIIAVSETTSTIASQTLLGQETPPELRGSVTGVYTVIGTTGAMTVNFLGGILFDRLSPVAPFLLVAALNLACLLLCILPGRQSFLSPSRPLEVI